MAEITEAETIGGRTKSRAFAFTILFFAAFFWGIQVIPLKLLLREWSSMTITAVRYLLQGLIIFAGLYWRTGHILPPRRAMKYLVLMGLCLSLNNIIQIMGIGLTTVTNATIISSTNPVNIPVLSVLILREKLHPHAWLGIFISFVGVLLVVANGSLSVITGMEFGLGDILCYIGIVGWGFYSITGVFAMRLISVPLATAWASFIAAGFAFLFNFFVPEINIVPLSQTGFWSFLFVLFCGGILANLFWNEGIELVGPATTSMFSNIMPIVGILSGYFIMGDEITMAKLIGAALVLLGVRLATAHR